MPRSPSTRGLFHSAAFSRYFRPQSEHQQTESDADTETLSEESIIEDILLSTNSEGDSNCSTPSTSYSELEEDDFGLSDSLPDLEIATNVQPRHHRPTIHYALLSTLELASSAVSLVLNHASSAVHLTKTTTLHLSIYAFFLIRIIPSIAVLAFKSILGVGVHTASRTWGYLVVGTTSIITPIRSTWISLFTRTTKTSPPAHSAPPPAKPSPATRPIPARSRGRALARDEYPYYTTFGQSVFIPPPAGAVPSRATVELHAILDSADSTHLEASGFFCETFDEKPPRYIYGPGQALYRCSWMASASSRTPWDVSQPLETVKSCRGRVVSITVKECRLSLTWVVEYLQAMPFLEHLDIREVATVCEGEKEPEVSWYTASDMGCKRNQAASPLKRTTHIPSPGWGPPPPSPPQCDGTSHPRLTHALVGLTITSRVKLDALFSSICFPSLKALSLRLYGEADETDFASIPKSILNPAKVDLRVRGDLTDDKVHTLQQIFPRNPNDTRRHDLRFGHVCNYCPPRVEDKRRQSWTKSQ